MLLPSFDTAGQKNNPFEAVSTLPEGKETVSHFFLLISVCFSFCIYVLFLCANFRSSLLPFFAILALPKMAALSRQILGSNAFRSHSMTSQKPPRRPHTPNKATLDQPVSPKEELILHNRHNSTKGHSKYVKSFQNCSVEK